MSATCASGHFSGKVLALDPHRLLSYSQRDMVERRPTASKSAVKHVQNFFLLDAETQQPVCLQHASSAAAILEGDLRVEGDTLIVTYYNATGAERWKHHFENLPALLRRENVNPHIPWLYNFKLDFRFK